MKTYITSKDAGARLIHRLRTPATSPPMTFCGMYTTSGNPGWLEINDPKEAPMTRILCMRCEEKANA